MPAKDKYHDAVKNALIKDGWTITHDPYTLSYGPRDVFADLGAERLLAAERGTEKILVEIKTFGGASEVRDLEIALGQFVLYRMLLERTKPDRKLFVAIPENAWLGIFKEPIGQLVLEELGMALVVFDPQREVLIKWIP